MGWAKGGTQSESTAQSVMIKVSHVAMTWTHVNEASGTQFNVVEFQAQDARVFSGLVRPRV